MKRGCTFHFLDVGQGSSCVVTYGDGRGFVIDCGPSGLISSQVVQKHVRWLDCVFVSHNHKDHAGGTVRILSDYDFRYRDLVPPAYWNPLPEPGQAAMPKREVWFLIDQPPTQIELYALFSGQLQPRGSKSNPPFASSKAAELASRWMPRRLEGGQAFADKEADIRVTCLSPTMILNQQVQARAGVGAALPAGATPASKPKRSKSQHANATSGVLVVTYEKNKDVIFGADATIEAWEGIYRRIPKRIECEVLVLPHHGGLMERDKCTRKQLEWFFGEVVLPKTVLISVGTANTYNHPRREVVKFLRNLEFKPGHKVGIVCTEITPRCCRSPAKLKPGVTAPTIFSQSGSVVGPRSVACAASITMTLGPGGVTWGSPFANSSRVCGWCGWQAFQDAIVDSSKEKKWRPLCRTH